MKLCSLTDVGVKREMNQDYFFVSEEPVGNLPNLFLVADGMGGHNAGEYASRCAVETIVKTIKESEKTDPIPLLKEGIAAANTVIRNQADSHMEMRGMGTTVVAAVIRDSQLTVANVGDSRLYVSGKELTQITQDHSLVQEMVRMGEMDADRARNHPDKNIITRAVGVDRVVEPDFFEVVLEPGQKIFLCSDGLSNMVEDEEIQNMLQQGKDPTEAAETLIRTANENGGKDNITLIVVDPELDEVKE